LQWESLTLAIEALSWIELRRINERLAIRRTARQLDIRGEVTMRRAFRLIMGVTRRRNALDHIAAQALGEESLGSLDLGVRNFIRIYVSELKYGGISIGEAVEMAGHAREILSPGELAPVEEALDLIPHTDLQLGDLSEDEATALRTFHPVWYVRYCTDLLGREEVLRLLNAPVPPTYIRINSLKCDEETVLKRLSREGVVLENEPALRYVFRVVDQDRPPSLLEAHREGLFTVQDKASALAGLIATPEPGMTVLDVCAAPGIKTGHLSEMMGDQGRIFSLDSSERRLGIWRREMARLGVENAVSIRGDARRPGDYPDVEADVVLVDPPCTGTGTFNRIPSGKWRVSRRSIGRMASIQRRILDACAGRVREGGRIVYCTCSVTLDENETVIRDFLGAHPGFKLTNAEPRVGLPGLMGQAEAQRLYPHVHGCNGFYVAKMVRR